MPRPSLSLSQARRVALAASGFAAVPRAGLPGRSALLAAVRRIGLLQVDSVNVLTRAHYLPLFSRLGAYDRQILDSASNAAPRALFEYWGHEASLLPVATHPLLRWRMDRVHEDAWGGMVRIKRENPGLVAEVAELVTELGPVTAARLETELAAEAGRSRTDWGWNWSEVKRALEYLFWAGEVSSAGRDETFRRRYASPSQVIPAKVLAAPTPDPRDAQRGLVAIAARSLGVATRDDLADYFRLTAAQARPAIADLVDAGELSEVSVPGWPQAYLHASARVPRAVHAEGLIVGFDPLIWYRPRVERLFAMRYRIEIYTPAHRRQHGYYVLPFLFGEELLARVDLKADRAAGALLVRAAHAEPGLHHDAVQALAGQLRALASWLDLPDVQVALGPDPLGAALAATLPTATLPTADLQPTHPVPHGRDPSRA